MPCSQIARDSCVGDPLSFMAACVRALGFLAPGEVIDACQGQQELKVSLRHGVVVHAERVGDSYEVSLYWSSSNEGYSTLKQAQAFSSAIDRGMAFSEELQWWLNKVVDDECS